MSQCTATPDCPCPICGRKFNEAPPIDVKKSPPVKLMVPIQNRKARRKAASLKRRL